MVFATAMSVFILYVNVAGNGLQPWVSWDYVHADWFRVDQYPTTLIPRYVRDQHFIIWYIIPLTSFIFFVFYGFSQEVRAGYVSFFRWIYTVLFCTKPKAPPMLPVS
jgi:pheromone a factor receptor